MTKAKQRLVIILPEKLKNMPVQIVRSSNHEQLVFNIEPAEEEPVCADKAEVKYAFIWRQNDFLKVALDEIEWVEADQSYSKIYLTGGRTLTISFNLATVEKQLPATDFIRIHRSYIVNMKHVVSLMGNSLKIHDQLLVIGREYQKKVLERFIFLGIRRKKPI